MNYDQQINNLAETIKADKSIIQPWRNKAVARLEEAQAFVRMGKTSAPAGLVHGAQNECSCVAGAIDKTCAVHGVQNGRK